MIKQALTKGGILGTIFIMWFFITPFMMNLGMMTMGIAGLLFSLGMIALIIVWIIKWRRRTVEANKHIPYVEAWMFVSIFLFTGFAVSSIFQMLFHLIYPAFMENFVYEMTDQTIEFMEEAGVMTDEGLTQLYEQEEQTLARLQPLNVLMNLVWSAIGTIGLSAIISLFVWKRAPKEPLPSTSADES